MFFENRKKLNILTMPPAMQKQRKKEEVAKERGRGATAASREMEEDLAVERRETREDSPSVDQVSLWKHSRAVNFEHQQQQQCQCSKHFCRK